MSVPWTGSRRPRVAATALAALATGAAGCARGIVRMERLSLGEANPTSFVFDVPVEEVERGEEYIPAVTPR